MSQQRHSSATRRVLLVTAAVFSVVLLYNAAFSRQQPQTRPLVIQSGYSKRDSSYAAAAAANITRFKQQLLAGMVPHFAKQNNASLPGYGLTDRDWQLFKPFISCPPNRPLTKYAGEEDGSKYMCAVHQSGQLRKDCIIYSLGSNGDFKYEQEMLSKTSCRLFTLDCTYNGTSQGPRHSYHKWCVASAATAAKRGPPYFSWMQITEKLGHTKVDILKIDVDGYEYEIVGDWGRAYAAAGAAAAPADGSSSRSSKLVLPDEIAMEVHMMIKPKPSARPWLQTWLAKLPKDIPHALPGMGLFFLSLAELGYGVYSMDINTGAPECCSEFSLLRVAGLQQ